MFDVYLLGIRVGHPALKWLTTVVRPYIQSTGALIIILCIYKLITATRDYSYSVSMHRVELILRIFGTERDKLQNAILYSIIVLISYYGHFAF